MDQFLEVVGEQWPVLLATLASALVMAWAEARGGRRRGCRCCFWRR